MKYEDLKKIHPAKKKDSGGAGLPDQPGVYFFMKGKKVLYIGKATSLRNRVLSYFREDLIRTRGPITTEMVARADALRWELTPSVLEALILEANLIKKYQPQYNVKEKDNKSFNFVVITKEDIPKVIVRRERELDFSKIKGTMFGPFARGPELREGLRILRRIFPFIDDSSSKKQNYQFYKQLGLTPDMEASEQYLENVKHLKLFFQGKKKDILRSLKKEMMLLAKKYEFERAGELKRQLFALEHLNDISLLKEENLTHNLFRIEAYDVAHMGGKNMVGVMVVVEEGIPNKNEYRKFRIRTQEDANDPGALAEVLTRRMSHPEWRYPDLIVVDGSTAQINAAKKVLVGVGKLIPVVSVIKDERHKPKALGGDRALGIKYEKEILLANSEAHRFAIAYHKNMRNKNFLK